MDYSNDSGGPMATALAAARAAAAAGEVPVGAAVVAADGAISRSPATACCVTMTRPVTPRSWRCAKRRRRAATPVYRLRSVRDLGALPNVRPGHLFRPHPPAVLWRL